MSWITRVVLNDIIGGIQEAIRPIKAAKMNGAGSALISLAGVGAGIGIFTRQQRGVTHDLKPQIEDTTAAHTPLGPT